MGKGQSKHGQCYLVNAHFNPLCQLEDTNSLQSVETPLTSQDSGLQLTPEISFTLSEEGSKNNSDKSIPTKCALQVFLPNEDVSAILKKSAMEKTDNAGTSSAESQQKVTLECVQNNNQSEEQEFSFVLRNYTGADRNDVEKIVLNSICEALQSSLKLPSSGSHTLKVHLTLSPDPEQNSSMGENTHEPCAKSISLPSASDNLCQPCVGDSVPTDKTSIPQKQPVVIPQCCQQEKAKSLLHSPLKGSKYEASPSPRTRRHNVYVDRKEARKWVDAAQFARRDFISPNLKNTPRHSIARESQQPNQEELHPSLKDCSHYLDLACLKISDERHSSHQVDQCDPRWLNPAYCSPRHVDRGHKNCRFQRYANLDFSNPSTPKKHGSELRHKQRETELHSGVLKHKLLQKAKSNLLDLSFDLCDLEDKQSVEQMAQFQHRRSRSYDTNEYSIMNSPKLVHRSCRCPKCITSTHYDEMAQLSPGRRHRHCHRKREKDKLRAMEQVARWLEREDSNCKQPVQNVSQNSETCSQDNVVERHEYHHVHEHHHYYHYVES